MKIGGIFKSKWTFINRSIDRSNQIEWKFTFRQSNQIKCNEIKHENEFGGGKKVEMDIIEAEDVRFVNSDVYTDMATSQMFLLLLLLLLLQKKKKKKKKKKMTTVQITTWRVSALRWGRANFWRIFDFFVNDRCPLLTFNCTCVSVAGLLRYVFNSCCYPPLIIDNLRPINWLIQYQLAATLHPNWPPWQSADLNSNWISGNVGG